jgi:hypothetical protein
MRPRLGLGKAQMLYRKSPGESDSSRVDRYPWITNLPPGRRDEIHFIDTKQDT